MLHGVDVSSYQGNPGQWMGEAGQIDWAAVKLTELSAAGPYINPAAAADWAWLKSKGLGRVGYMFGHPSTPALAATDLFIATLHQLGFGDGDMIALDHEVSDGVAPTTAAHWALSVLEMLHTRLGRLPVLYTFRSFATGGFCAGLDRFPLWIADPDHPAGQPAVPGPWARWSVHQYDLSAPIDRDLAAWPSLAAMRATLGAGTPPPVILEEETMPVLMKPGAGAITPLAIPGGTKHLVFSPETTAQVGVQFHNQGTTSINLDWQPQGSRIIAVPAGVQSARLHRIDAGTGDVSVSCQAV